MNEPTDKLGRPLGVGDWIACAQASGSSATLTIGMIGKFNFRANGRAVKYAFQAESYTIRLLKFPDPRDHGEHANDMYSRDPQPGHPYGWWVPRTEPDKATIQRVDNVVKVEIDTYEYVGHRQWAVDWLTAEGLL